jgi:hypothetical protein
MVEHIFNIVIEYRGRRWKGTTIFNGNEVNKNSMKKDVFFNSA